MEVHGYLENGFIGITIAGKEFIVPDDPANRHRIMVAEWEEAGNVIPPYIPPPLPIEAYENAIQAVVDATANAKMFRDGVTLASYKDSTNPQWAAEASTFIAWRDSVWGYAYMELAKVQGGVRTQPTVEEFLNEIESITWP